MVLDTTQLLSSHITTTLQHPRAKTVWHRSWNVCVEQQNSNWIYDRRRTWIKPQQIDPTPTQLYRICQQPTDSSPTRVDGIIIQRQLRYRSARPFVQVSNIIGQYMSAEVSHLGSTTPHSSNYYRYPTAKSKQHHYHMAYGGRIIRSTWTARNDDERDAANTYSTALQRQLWSSDKAIHFINNQSLLASGGRQEHRLW